MGQPPVNLGALLTRAHAKVREKKFDAAIGLFKQVLETAPDNLDAHAFLSREYLRREDVTNAVRHAELAVHAKLADIKLHETLAKAHQQLNGKDDAERILTAVCDELPFAFTSLLCLSRLREVRGDKHEALLGYTRAIKTAQLRGLWIDRESTPPWLAKAVQYAMRFARERRLAFFNDWLSPMQQRHGRDEMRRVAECLEMYLGIKPTVHADPRQKPSFLYFPGLPIAPVFPRDALPFADWYESQTDIVREEAERVLQERSGEITAFHYTVPEERRKKLTAGGNWDAYFFFNSGERFDEHHDACPKTSEVLAQLPLDHVRQHGPEVCYSIMRPGAHILPHRGVTNTRSVLHLGLDIPPDCALNLTEVEAVHWQPGKCFAFDDTYEHEAWNRSDTTRVILLGDIWNPYLTEPERDAVADLVGIIGDFNRATDAVPL